MCPTPQNTPEITSEIAPGIVPGSRFVTIREFDGEESMCSNCYLYGYECENCENTDTELDVGIMTFEEFKSNSILNGDIHIDYEQFSQMSITEFFEYAYEHSEEYRTSLERRRNPPILDVESDNEPDDSGNESDDEPDDSGNESDDE